MSICASETARHLEQSRAVSSPIPLRLSGREPAAPVTGFAFSRKGFRPFFLLAAVSGALLVPLWILALQGTLVIAWSTNAVLWHAHEMVFGYTSAVIAGFLLTAAARWTDRETLVGAPLLGLAALWMGGRIVMTLPMGLPLTWIAAIDLAFLPVLTAVVARPIVLSRSKRNYGIIAVLAAFSAANLVMHLDVLGVAPAWGRTSALFGTSLTVLLMALIAARIVPMFTRNALRDERIRALPALDRAALVAIGALIAAELTSGDSWVTGTAAALAAVLLAARTWFWGGWQSRKDPMLWVLHVGHLWMVVGLALKAATPLWPVASSAATHALTAGAIGCLTLGMMARVSLGHTGRMIVASSLTRISFVLMLVAGSLRVIAPLIQVSYLTLLAVSAAAWALSLLLFVVEYSRVLAQPRADGAPG